MLICGSPSAGPVRYLRRHHSSDSKIPQLLGLLSIVNHVGFVHHGVFDMISLLSKGSPRVFKISKMKCGFVPQHPMRWLPSSNGR